jgi:hypothetical protein
MNTRFFPVSSLKALFMKGWPASMALLCVVLFVSCGEKQKVEGTPLSGEPQTGALYSLNDGEGGFRAGKVIVAEDDIIFIHLFGNRWTSRPSLSTAKEAGNPTAIAYSPQSFSSMQPVHLEGGSVSAEELSAYDTWRRSKRPIF